MENLKPMGAVTALYAPDQHELAEAIIASLSRAIFHENEAKPAGKGKLFVGRFSHKLVRWTTRAASSQDESGAKITLFKNRLIERSGHPYAQALLTTSQTETAALVEGGDPMNGPYMMLSRKSAKTAVSGTGSSSIRSKARTSKSASSTKPSPPIKRLDACWSGANPYTSRRWPPGPASA